MTPHLYQLLFFSLSSTASVCDRSHVIDRFRSTHRPCARNCHRLEGQLNLVVSWTVPKSSLLQRTAMLRQWTIVRSWLVSQQTTLCQQTAGSLVHWNTCSRDVVSGAWLRRYWVAGAVASTVCQVIVKRGIVEFSHHPGGFLINLFIYIFIYNTLGAGKR